jgi:hypothetical protein
MLVGSTELLAKIEKTIVRGCTCVVVESSRPLSDAYVDGEEHVLHQISYGIFYFYFIEMRT